MEAGSATAVIEQVGAQGPARPLVHLPEPPPVPETGVLVQTLGAFRVLRDGQAVPASAWRSRKARDLLKILIAKRGRPVNREWVVEVLWPGETLAGIGNRLNVVVSTVRSILDPRRAAGPDGPVLADGDALLLAVDQVDIDVELFLADAAAGLALARERRGVDARERLARAEVAYTGAFLEADLYEDWAVPLREEARFVYREVTTWLARHARDDGDLAAATCYWLRVLELDPYDEAAHLGLVGALAAGGRHGEARRHYGTYCSRMADLAVDPAPFPDPAPASPSSRG